MINYYYNKQPEINELVLVNFTEKMDSYFKAQLIEYKYSGILNFQDATKKKKIKSWNNIITLNKNMVARVEDIDNIHNSIQLSLNYMNDEYNKDITLDKLQQKLLVYFNENKLMEKFIKSFCIIYKYTFTDIWVSIIHQLDKKRVEEDNKKSIWKYFIENINNIDLLLNIKLIINVINVNKIFSELKDLYNQKYNTAKQKCISRFGIISNIGIDIVKEIFTTILNKINTLDTEEYILDTNKNNLDIDTDKNTLDIDKKLEFNLYYESTPYYILETISENVNNNMQLMHNKFINYLLDEIINKQIFVKKDYIGKMIL